MRSCACVTRADTDLPTHPSVWEGEALSWLMSPSSRPPAKAMRLLRHGDLEGVYTSRYTAEYTQQRNARADERGTKRHSRERDHDYRVMAAIIASWAWAEQPLAPLMVELRVDQPGSRYYHRRRAQLEAKASKRRAEGAMTRVLIDKHLHGDLRALDDEIEGLYLGSRERYAERRRRFRREQLLPLRQFAAVHRWLGPSAPSQQKVYFALLHVAAQVGGLDVRVDERRLARLTLLRPDTVRKAVKRLLQDGLIMKQEPMLKREMSRYLMVRRVSHYRRFVPVPGCAARVADLSSAALDSTPTLDPDHIACMNDAGVRVAAVEFLPEFAVTHPAFRYGGLDQRFYHLMPRRRDVSFEALRGCLDMHIDDLERQIAWHIEFGMLTQNWTGERTLHVDTTPDGLDRAARYWGFDESAEQLRAAMEEQRDQWAEVQREREGEAHTYYPEDQDLDAILDQLPDSPETTDCDT